MPRRTVSRRPYGGWSIDHRPERQRRPWRVRPPASVDPRRPSRFFPTRGEAEQYVMQAVERLAAPRPDLTLGDWLDHWLDVAGDAAEWSESTRLVYAGQLQHLAPLYDVRLAALTLGQLRTRLAEMARAGVRRFRQPDGTLATRPLSTRSRRDIVATWRRALQDAVDEGYLSDSPARKLRPPKHVQQEGNTWSPVEARRLVQATRGHRFEVAVALVVGCALRIGEVLALAWDDVDTANRTILVRRTGTRKVVQDHTKSRRVRTVSLPSPVWSALLRHREHQHAGAVYVLERQPGVRWTYKTLRAELLAITQAAGIPDYGWHAGRHATASYLLASGASPAEVARLLGHASPAITLAVYAHAVQGADLVAGMAGALWEDAPEAEKRASGARQGTEQGTD